MSELQEDLDKNTIESYIARCKEWASETLRDAGYPEPWEKVLWRSNNSWVRLPQDFEKMKNHREEVNLLKKVGVKVEPGDKIAMGWAMVINLPSNSPAHNAGKIAYFARLLHLSFKKNEPKGSAHLAVQLAQAVARTIFKLDQEETLWRGIQFKQKGPKSGGKISAKGKIDDAKDSREYYQRVAEEVWHEMLQSRPNRKWNASEVAQNMTKKYPDIGNW